MKIQIKNCPLTNNQKELVSYTRKYKYIMACWSRQQGKTTVATYLCIKWLFSNNSEQIIYFTPTYSLAKTIYNKLMKILPNVIINKSNSSDLFIESVTGNTIKFFSGESAQTARGSNCTRLIIDEAAYFKDQIDGQSFYYNIVLPLFKAKGKTLIMISTPFGKKGFFYELCQKAQQGADNYIYSHKTIYDDSLVTPDQLKELKEGYPDIAWRTEFLAEFIDDAFTVFTNYKDCYSQQPINITNPCWCGIDVSTVGTDDTVLTVIDRDGNILQHIVTGTLDNKYTKLANLINYYKPRCTYIESNSIGIAFINEIKKLTIHKIKEWLTTNKTKNELVDRLAILLQQRQLHYSDKVLLSELSTFSFKTTKAGTITYNAINGCKDDSVMSLGFAIRCRDFESQGDLSTHFIKNNRRKLQ